MEPKTRSGLTLMDVAILADGLGNIRDETAERLAPLIRQDERFAEELEALRQMARDAGARCLADGLDTHRRFCTLRDKPWTKPLDVLDPCLDVPYAELIAMASARARRADGAEKAELHQLMERLVLAFGEDMVGDKHFKLWLDRLFQLEEPVAEAALEHLVGYYRACRAKGGAEAGTAGEVAGNGE